jgi:hypothetical protein
MSPIMATSTLMQQALPRQFSPHAAQSRLAKLNKGEAARRVRAEFDKKLDRALPITNQICACLARCRTGGQQYVFLKELTKSPKLAARIYAVARQIQRASGRFPMHLAVLLHLMAGSALCKHPATRKSKIARFSQRMMGDEVGFSFNPIKAVKKAAKATINVVKKAGAGVAKGIKAAGKVASSAIKMTKGMVFGAIRSIFGAKIGGFIINVIEILTSGLGLAKDLVIGVIKAVGYLVSDPKRALNELLVTLNKVIMNAAIVPLALAFQLTPDQMRRVIDQAARRNKLMALQLVSLFFSAISINPPQIVTQLLSVLGPVIKGLLQEIGGRVASLASKGVDVATSAIVMVMNGAGSWEDVAEIIAAKIGLKAREQVQKLKTGLENAAKKLAQFNLKGFAQSLIEVVKLKDLAKAAGKFTVPSVTKLLGMDPKNVLSFASQMLAETKGQSAIATALQQLDPKKASGIITQLASKQLGREAIARALASGLPQQAGAVLDTLLKSAKGREALTLALRRAPEKEARAAISALLESKTGREALARALSASEQHGQAIVSQMLQAKRGRAAVIEAVRRAKQQEGILRTLMGDKNFEAWKAAQRASAQPAATQPGAMQLVPPPALLTAVPTAA